jgi:hypothetical protein
MKMNGEFFKKSLLLVAIILAVRLNKNIFQAKAALENAAAPASKEIQRTKEIAGYKRWTRVNAKPIKMEASLAVLCAPALPQPKNDSPHKDKFIVVFVNEIGRKAMQTQTYPQFPQGAIIVKEKLLAPDSLTPELLTAMVKRQKGFNPASNDWEFVVFSGDAKTVQAQGKLENCIACHTAKRGSDFVFRNYLSNEDLMKLK